MNSPGFTGIVLVSLLMWSTSVGLISCSNNPNDTETVAQEVMIPKDIEGITNLIKQDRTNASLFHERALLHLKSGKFDEALNDIKIAVKLDAKQPLYHFTFGEILFAQGDIARSAEELKTCISLDSKNIEALLKLAKVQMYMQKYKNSISTLKQVIELDKHNENAFYIQGLIFKQLSDTGNAINSFEKAVEFNGDFFDAYFQLGIIHYELSRPIAEHYFTTAFALDPDNTELIYALGMCYQRFGFLDKAIDIYYTLLEKNIKHAEAHYNLGYIHLGSKEEYPTAHKHFTNAINCDSAYANAFYMRGLCEEKMGNLIKARTDYKTCLELETNHDLAILGMNRLDEEFKRN
jgi:tetratricopeptide (TPR) repeat protein